jgi:two-component system, sensor histidine kinase LadS
MRLILFSLLLLQSLSASITLNEGPLKFDSFTISYLYDKENTLDINMVSSIPFTQKISNQFSEGYRRGTAWFKLDIYNKSDYTEFILFFSESLWSRFDLYRPSKKGWIVDHNGLNMNLKDRSIESINPTFSLNLQKNEHKTYYIKAETVSAHLGELTLFETNEFFRPSRVTLSSFYTFYTGIITAVLLLNIILFIALRERIYFYYTLYVALFIVFVGMHSGDYFLLGFNGWIEGLHTIGAILLLALLLFSMTFLELKKRLYQMYQVIIVLNIGLFLFAVLIFYDVPYTSLLFNFFSSSVLLSIMISAIIVYRRGLNIAKYYLLALIVYMVSMAFMVLVFNGILDYSSFARYAFLGGALFEIIFFTLMLSNRIHDAKVKQIEMQKALLVEKENIEKNLDIKVKERTEELEQVKEQLTVESRTDALCSVYNRRHFSDVSHSNFQDALNSQEALSIIMIDIDWFKTINDTFGHAAGDKVLVECAETFVSLVRESDIVARYGGEEFVIMIAHSNKNNTLRVAEDIREAIERQEIQTDDGEIIHLTVSLGDAVLSENDETVESLIKRADTALYEAKENGRNRVEFSH